MFDKNKPIVRKHQRSEINRQTLQDKDGNPINQYDILMVEVTGDLAEMGNYYLVVGRDGMCQCVLYPNKFFSINTVKKNSKWIIRLGRIKLW